MLWSSGAVEVCGGGAMDVADEPMSSAGDTEEESAVSCSSQSDWLLPLPARWSLVIASSRSGCGGTAARGSERDDVAEETAKVGETHAWVVFCACM